MSSTAGKISKELFIGDTISIEVAGKRAEMIVMTVFPPPKRETEASPPPQTAQPAATKTPVAQRRYKVKHLPPQMGKLTAKGKRGADDGES